MMLAYIIIALCTFGLSSAWLYSPGPEKLRNFVAEKGGPLAPLSYCQLCCSFWIALILSYCLLDWTFLLILYASLGSSGISWMLGNITLSAMWIKAYFETKYYDLTKK